MLIVLKNAEDYGIRDGAGEWSYPLHPLENPSDEIEWLSAISIFFSPFNILEYQLDVPESPAIMHCVLDVWRRGGSVIVQCQDPQDGSECRMLVTGMEELLSKVEPPAIVLRVEYCLGDEIED